MRWASLVLIAWLGANVAAAQTALDVGDHPEGTGTVTGTVHLADGTPGADLEVALVSFVPDGTQGLSRVQSEPDGSFVFEGLSTEPEIAYYVVANQDGVRHSEKASFGEGREELRVSLRVAPTTADAGARQLGESFLRIETGCGGLRVTETHELENPTESVLFVPEAERGERDPIFEILLPERAGAVTSHLGMFPVGSERRRRLMRFWGPLYPGTQRLEYSYALPDGEAQWSFPAGTPQVQVVLDAESSALDESDLRPGPPLDIASRPQRTFLAGPLAPGESLTLPLEAGSAGATSGTVERAHVWIELDDATVSVDEQLRFRAPAIARADPLLCWTVPEGAFDIRFSQDAFALGLTRDPSGQLEIPGPLPPGPHVLAVSYRLPADGAVDLTRRFGSAVPLLSVAVADTGILAETGRLHRRRPVRVGERNYLHLEAFQIEPNEEIDLTLSRLPAPQSLPRFATAGFALAAVLGVVFYVGAPLRRPAAEAPTTETRADQLAAERAAVYAAIADLDDDLDTGKITAEDHQRLRAELKSEAVQLLEAERSSPEKTAEAAEPRCATCSTRLPEQARFCPNCGTALDENT